MAVFIFVIYIVFQMYVHHRQEELHSAQLMSSLKQCNIKQYKFYNEDGNVIYLRK